VFRGGHAREAVGALRDHLGRAEAVAVRSAGEAG
jgi:hypothetical protein